MSVRLSRKSVALGVAALVLGFAGTSTASADHRDNWGRGSFQSRQWRGDSHRRSWSRDDDCNRRNRYDSCRRDNYRRHDWRFDFYRRDNGRNRCR